MIVFGESTLNDAVAIALSQSVSEVNQKVLNGENPDYKMAALLALGKFFMFFFGSLLLGFI